MKKILSHLTRFSFVPTLLIGTLLWFSLPDQSEARVGLPAPEITNKTWLNSQPKRLTDLRGKVVLVEFWTFGCYNCPQHRTVCQRMAQEIFR